jgi:hypothetical protein
MHSALVGWLASIARDVASEARVTELHGGKTPYASTVSDRHMLNSETVAVQVAGTW